MQISPVIIQLNDTHKRFIAFVAKIIKSNVCTFSSFLKMLQYKHVHIVIASVIFSLLFANPSHARRRGSKPVKHPSKLQYPELRWKVPLGTPYRHKLKNGLRAYIAADSSLPLVKLVGYVQGGTLMDPKGMEGLGHLCFELMKTGGTEAYASDTIDALCERLAIRISFSISESHGKFKASFLSRYTDTALTILNQMLFSPQFERKRIERQKGIFMEKLHHRFDNPAPTLKAAYKKAMYPNGANSRFARKEKVAQITREDIVDYHRSIIKTENIIMGISGNFETDSMISHLETLFPPFSKDKSSCTLPSPATAPSTKCLVVHKPISQAYVRMGIPMFQRPHKHYYPMSVLNMILGGAAFISRLGTKVRSDEGLTYSIYSQAESNYAYPATFYIQFFTKSQTINKAIYLCLRETKELLKNGITDKELQNAKKILIDGLPSMFRKPEDLVDNYAWSEYYGRKDSHFVEYADKIRALEKKDIMEVAQNYLKPDKFTYVVVGDSTMLFSAEKQKEFSIKDLSPRTILPQHLIIKDEEREKDEVRNE